ncbi:uncharacterized protein ARMOST_15214 [Armillaria ostoyae]|uniref:Uncharacterized protein n=1 Tax=Armillaria ostoyae TaxID=47428 RepID=A0A284RSR2_ARMOS|nr:uncharacterized protein ARMOST_15214 [Armillaria ostoyae]
MLEQSKIKELYFSLSKQFIGNDSQLNQFGTTQSIHDNFKVSAEYGDTVYITWQDNEEEEALFQIQGVITELQLPPVKQDIRVQSTNDLCQFVKIISPGGTNFQRAVQTVVRFIEFMEEAMGNQVAVQYTMHSGQAHKLCFYSRLLTPAHAANAEDIIKLPASYDPSNSL